MTTFWAVYTAVCEKVLDGPCTGERAERFARPRISNGFHR
jgi:hypothetical protein